MTAPRTSGTGNGMQATLNWERWEAMRVSLDYCCARIVELGRGDPEDRAELDELVEYGTRLAARLLYLPDAPPLSTSALRAQWQTGCAAVQQTLERIVAAAAARVDVAETLARGASDR